MLPFVSQKAIISQCTQSSNSFGVEAINVSSNSVFTFSIFNHFKIFKLVNALFNVFLSFNCVFVCLHFPSTYYPKNRIYLYLSVLSRTQKISMSYLLSLNFVETTEIIARLSGGNFNRFASHFSTFRKGIYKCIEKCT